MGGEPVWLLVLIAVAGMLLAAALSAGETAVVRVSRASVAQLAEDAASRQDERREARVRRMTVLVDDAAGVQASASLVRILAEMTSTACITLAVGAWLDAWWAVLLVAVAISLVVAVLLVRTSPRTVGRTRATGVLGVLSGLLLAVSRATRWLRPVVRPSPPTPEEQVDALRELVERAGETEDFEEDDRELIRSVFELGDTIVREVMVPRTEMVTIGGGERLDKALRLFLRSGFSRVPVTGESTDDLLGVLYFKDVVRVLTEHPDQQRSRRARDAARPAVFVPESKRADDLLREMQAAANHMAMVVDEYGGIAGLVTIEDVIEEIVGELTDEHDRSGPELEDLGDGSYRVPARMSLDDLGDLFDVEIDDDDVDSAGGLLAKALGKVPIAGAKAEAHGLRLVAERVEGRRRTLATVLVRRAPLPAPPDTDGAHR